MKDEKNQKQPKGFAKAKEKASQILDNGKKLSDLMQKAVTKSEKRKGSLHKVWNELQTLFRLIKAYISGNYRDVSTSTMILAVAAVVYFVNPFDVIPDFLAGVGFLDDATILGYVLANIRTETDKFRAWEESFSAQ